MKNYLEASATSAARISGHLENILCEEASHQGAGEEEKEEEVYREQDSKPGISEI